MSVHVTQYADMICGAASTYKEIEWAADLLAEAWVRKAEVHVTSLDDGLEHGILQASLHGHIRHKWEMFNFLCPDIAPRYIFTLICCALICCAQSC